MNVTTALTNLQEAVGLGHRPGELVTRINVVAPTQLTDQHLLAEIRELPRIFPHALTWRTARASSTLPETYRLGTGHMRFFYDKLGWLAARHAKLTEEWLGRGFRLTQHPPLTGVGDWAPTGDAVAINLERLDTRLRAKPLGFYRYRGQPVTSDFYSRACS